MNKNNDNIKNILSQDISNTLDDFLNNDEHEDKYEGNFTGLVVDNNDPDKVGKCKIRVFGVHSDNIQDRDLPWAFPDFGFRGGLKGSFVIPPINCFVNVYFERGEIYTPRYSTKVIDENNLPTNKNTDYPDNMIFFETDNGDKFEINRQRKTTLFEHSSGTKVSIDAIGNITLESVGNISLKHKIMTESNGRMVIPLGSGPFIALPYDTLTGLPQAGNQTF